MDLELPSHTVLGQPVDERTIVGADDLKPKPGACNVRFNAPKLIAGDLRNKVPCHLTHGHTGRHENSKGVTWGTRSSTPQRAVIATRQTAPAPAGRNTLMTPTANALKARMQRLGKQMQQRQQAPAPRPRTAPEVFTPSNPLDAAQRAVQLAAPPQWGWLASERRVVLERLEQAGTALLQHAIDHRATDTAQRREIEQLRHQLYDVRSALLPGVTIDIQQTTLDRLTSAMRALHQPLADEQRVHNAMVLNFRRRADAFSKPVPEAPRHPWLPGRHVA